MVATIDDGKGGIDESKKRAPRAGDYAELAKALGMPQGSIGPTRGRCLAKLRLALAQDPTWEMR